ncbi:hypothetical protein GTS_22650 [Gandjariella thermophila]|uniref:Putative T7SS secretion signal domain-containing protein n=1 Tax=Gandjariella thermophila TaxID=1931992 RepID=A0A4D4J6A5_9PSEU|nr:hypothetical protein GTS_22650 [Gandjariella thermophila]
MVRNVEVIDRIGAGLGGVDPGRWTGAASTAFRDAFGAEPPRWLRAVDIAAEGGRSLADYADVLTWGQGEAQRAIELYTQAQAASRAAAAQYEMRTEAAAAGGQTVAPFQDPGQSMAQAAQAILDNARGKVEQVGGAVATAFGFEPDGHGGFKKSLGEDREFGADHRKKNKVWDKQKKEWVEEDPGGWQKGRGGRSYQREFGDPADGLLGDKIAGTLKALGIDVPEQTWEASAGVDVAHGSLEGDFKSGPFSGKGTLEGSVLGADAKADAGVGPLGAHAAASAEAYLARGSAEGEVKLGGHAGVSGKAEGMVGAKAEAQGSAGWTGAQGSAEAFAGARAEGEASAEVAGVGAGVHGEAWAGAGAEASGQFGMGTDGKFHVGGSVGLALGVGGKVGFDMSVDPHEVVDTVHDVAGDVGHVAGDVGHGVTSAAKDVGHFLGL